MLVQSKRSDRLIKLVNTGQNFAELAKKNSVGRTAAGAGILVVARGEMTKPFLMQL